MKIMSSHGLLEENPDHKTYRLVGGVWKSFHYAEPFSHHNRAKHWVDDVNQRRHGDIGLDEVWATKWWPNRQFTFLLLIAEVNAGQARARAMGETAEPSLEFRKKMAHKMLMNKLNDYGVTGGSPARVRRRESNEQVHRKWAKHEGMWNATSKKFERWQTEYIHHPCSVCHKTMWSYCICCPGCPLCVACFGVHAQDHAH